MSKISSKAARPRWQFALILAAVCNQDVYDGIYRQIIQQALLSRVSNQVTFQRRNNAIEALRALCQGQVSSYEKQNLTQARIDSLQ